MSIILATELTTESVSKLADNVQSYLSYSEFHNDYSGTSEQNGATTELPLGTKVVVQIKGAARRGLYIGQVTHKSKHSVEVSYQTYPTQPLLTVKVDRSGVERKSTSEVRPQIEVYSYQAGDFEQFLELSEYRKMVQADDDKVRESVRESLNRVLRNTTFMTRPELDKLHNLFEENPTLSNS